MNYGRQLLQLTPVGGCSVYAQSSSPPCASPCSVTCVNAAGATVGTITVKSCLRVGCVPCDDMWDLASDCTTQLGSTACPSGANGCTPDNWNCPSG